MEIMAVPNPKVYVLKKEDMETIKHLAIGIEDGWIDGSTDEAIEKFVSLKEEDPSYAVKPAGAHWIEEHDDTVNKVIYICSNCGAVFDGLPRSPFCPSCKVLMTGGK